MGLYDSMGDQVATLHSMCGCAAPSSQNLCFAVPADCCTRRMEDVDPKHPTPPRHSSVLNGHLHS